MVFEGQEFRGVLADSKSLVRSSDPLENVPESFPGAKISSSRLFADRLFDVCIYVEILTTG